MTTYFNLNVENSQLEIYPLGEADPIILENDGTGFTIPDDILIVLADEFDTSIDNYNIERALRLVRDAAFEDIVEGTP